jgi:hypothetical protein
MYAVRMPFVVDPEQIRANGWGFGCKMASLVHITASEGNDGIGRG